jgi:uncharacterized protein (DUF2236 family)
MSTGLFPSDAEIQQLLVDERSVAWRYGSDARLYLVALYALLLQVAHPTVGAGVRDYSDFDSRPWKRLLRTLDYVTLLIYGGQDAIAAGRRLRALHKGFQGVREDGERYYALEPTAYAWVHATLIDSYVTGHRYFGRPMRPDQVERFYREYRGLGRLIGVRERDLPEDWAGFRTYFDEVVRTELAHTVTVDRVLGAVMHTPPPLPLPRLLWRPLRLPMTRALWLGSVGPMPPELRDRLEVAWTPRDERQFRALGTVSRNLTPVLPRRLQVMGPAQLRLRRRAIARGPLGPGADRRTAVAGAVPGRARAA